ncbi:mCG1041703 [Mus musculus]|nr:mCG1041703 [Mus musculus]
MTPASVDTLPALLRGPMYACLQRKFWIPRGQNSLLATVEKENSISRALADQPQLTFVSYRSWALLSEELWLGWGLLQLGFRRAPGFITGESNRDLLPAQQDLMVLSCSSITELRTGMGWKQGVREDGGCTSFVLSRLENQNACCSPEVTEDLQAACSCKTKAALQEEEHLEDEGAETEGKMWPSRWRNRYCKSGSFWQEGNRGELELATAWGLRLRKTMTAIELVWGKGSAHSQVTHQAAESHQPQKPDNQDPWCFHSGPQADGGLSLCLLLPLHAYEVLIYMINFDITDEGHSYLQICMADPESSYSKVGPFCLIKCTKRRNRRALVALSLDHMEPIMGFQTLTEDKPCILSKSSRELHSNVDKCVELSVKSNHHKTLRKRETDLCGKMPTSPVLMTLEMMAAIIGQKTPRAAPAPVPDAQKLLLTKQGCSQPSSREKQEGDMDIWVLQRQAPIGLPPLALISVNSHELLEQKPKPESSTCNLGSNICYSNDESSCVSRKKKQMDEIHLSLGLLKEAHSAGPGVKLSNKPQTLRSSKMKNGMSKNSSKQYIRNISESTVRATLHLGKLQAARSARYYPLMKKGKQGWERRRKTRPMGEKDERWSLKSRGETPTTTTITVVNGLNVGNLS